MGLWEKKRLRNFYIFVSDVDLNDPKTWKDIDFNKMNMREVYKKYKLEDNTIDFLGHAVALYRNDDYLD
jgi:Rab GDP dissociation inhibitor